MKNLLFIFVYFLFACTCYAQEKCDYKFFDGIPVKSKIVGKLPSGENIMDHYIIDSYGNLLTGTICQYSGSTIILKENVINGKVEGIGQSYYNNGNKKWETEYKNGIPNGFSKYYFNDGSLDKVFQYRDGKAISAECASGYKWSETEISNWNYGGEIRNSVRNICKNK